ncbi:hypothetical protein TBC1_11958 [Lentimicrobium saccharophilum]|uniref:Uncharacterized protein n=1 Tax=Lentimicrobium saccharophilum TaxID=1678841 RepID=A0A0S7BXA4_9BACT|nr:hypothetical protein TBC1_11958 [Lentimicrobium saccharophilum]
MQSIAGLIIFQNGLGVKQIPVMIFSDTQLKSNSIRSITEPAALMECRKRETGFASPEVNA